MKPQIRMVGAEQRQRDAPGDLPRAGAVDGGGLLQLVRDVLQSGQQQHDPEADVLPRQHHEDGEQHDVHVGQPELDQAAEAERLEHLVGEAARLQDQRPHDPGDRRRQHVGREDHRAQEPAAEELAVQQQGDADRQRPLDDHGRHGQLDRVLDRRDEGRVVERVAVVPEPDGVIQRPVARPVVEAVVGRDDDGDEDEAHEQDQAGGQQDRELCPLAQFRAAPPGRAKRPSRGGVTRRGWAEPGFNRRASTHNQGVCGELAIAAAVLEDGLEK